MANKDKLKDSFKLDEIIDFMSNLDKVDQTKIAELAKAQTYIKEQISALINAEKKRNKVQNIPEQELLKFEYEVDDQEAELMEQFRADHLSKPMKVKAHSFQIVNDADSEIINWKNPEF